MTWRLCVLFCGICHPPVESFGPSDLTELKLRSTISFEASISFFISFFRFTEPMCLVNRALLYFSITLRLGLRVSDGGNWNSGVVNLSGTFRVTFRCKAGVYTPTLFLNWARRGVGKIPVTLPRVTRCFPRSFSFTLFCLEHPQSTVTALAVLPLPYSFDNSGALLYVPHWVADLYAMNILTLLFSARCVAPSQWLHPNDCTPTAPTQLQHQFARVPE